MASTKVKEIIAMVEADGWFMVRQKGSHRHYHHKTKKGNVTIPGKESSDLKPGTLRSILSQAQITIKEEQK